MSTHPDSTLSAESPGGRLSRWFSIRRGSTHHYEIGGKDGRSNSFDAEDKLPSQSTATVMPKLSETEEDDTANKKLLKGMGNNGTLLSLRGSNFHLTPTLPAAPAGLSQHQLKRRHIVAAIVHSENSYVATLQRLVNDYKKPLEESSPPILSYSKISTLFHRLPEILQCHTLFRIALADCIRNWDREERLGDVFVGSFGKPVILEIYSAFINNFSVAMELAKMEAKRKSALADFFKVKQISAHDRLSFFGLMVKPVQRFPQFILFLQDLLKYTPYGHHDRMSLQLALTQLESLAEMLNERKREAEQCQAFKEMLAHISGTFNTRSLSSDGNRNRYLLREDNVTQMEFNQSGFIVKSKQRRLLLLNDKIICVSVAPKQSHDFGASEKLSFKWMYPVADMDIIDNSTSATLSRHLTAGLNRGASIKSNSSDSSATLSNGADNLCSEMGKLMHDFEVMSRINDMVGSLNGSYDSLNVGITKQILTSIQKSIQKKDEEMAWVDSCCLQLVAKNKNGKEETFTFQTENPSVKKDWITELRLAQLALDANNSPAWDVPEHDQRPSTKMPLFVKAQSVYKSKHQNEVRCGCYYTTTNHNRSSTRQRSKKQNYLWICTTDGTSSHVSILLQHTQRCGEFKEVGSFDLVEQLVTSIEYVKGITSSVDVTVGLSNDRHQLLPIDGDTIWMGTNSRKVLIYVATNPEQEKQIESFYLPATITQILYHLENVFISLSNGTMHIFRRGYDGRWIFEEPQIVSLGCSPIETVSNIIAINSNVYASCGRKVWVIDGKFGEILKPFEIHNFQQSQNVSVNLMAHSGIGLWVSLKNSSVICLYHTETFKHLQDINIASNILRVTSSQRDSINNNALVFVTSLMACKGLLWVGTNLGISLTIPLPRLEGVPIISGGVNISLHAHFGPITFMLPLVAKTLYKPPENPTAEQPSDVQNLPNDDKSETENTINTPDTTLESEIKVELESKLDKINSQEANTSNSKVAPDINNSPVVLRRRRFKDSNENSRLSKTLPRGLGTAKFATSIHSNTSSSQGSQGFSDVFGLYGDLIFVKENLDADNGPGNIMDSAYECLRQSDPELAAIPAKVSTLDRRLRMKVCRPRSLDLSNWSVESKSSSLYTSSGSEESMGIRHSLYAGRSISRNGSSASHKASANVSDLMNISENGSITTDLQGFSVVSSTPVSSAKKDYGDNEHAVKKETFARATLKKKKNENTNTGIKADNSKISGQKTILTIMGGRGYINWKHVWYNGSGVTDKLNKSNNEPILTRVPNSNDAHIVIWEKKL